MTLTQRLTEILDLACNCGQQESHKDIVTAILTAIRTDVERLKSDDKHKDCYLESWCHRHNENVSDMRRYNQAIADVLELIK
jgi:nanoRNase/pAp phosphatase (c-di-AMP/oligoRNAs hydrolase)